jgi:hypothetical protein
MDSLITKQRLEFHEGHTYQWHIETEGPDSHEENTHGWHTVASWQPYDKVTAFVNYVEATYKRRLSFRRVAELWKAFDAGYKVINKAQPWPLMN